MEWAAPSSWTVVVLAAGKGKRMGSSLPKVLHPVLGVPLLAHVLATARHLDPQKLFVVVGHGADQVKASFHSEELSWVDQTEQLGTGDAVARVAPYLETWNGPLMVLYGDVPLLRPWTLAALMETHIVQKNGATILTAEMPDPSGYGRILRDADGGFLAIREDADLKPVERAIAEINSGIGVFECPKLFRALRALRTENAQGEYYLTDVIEWFRGEGDRVGTLRLADPVEISGINTPQELEAAGK
ncbi:MAG: NTP transferase domain-containing protein, partial [Candidatus Eisenbacteria bacterium]|nr:NTP transferase domain-containing protein [Candidatus Eisenbacteria bacterium]